MTGSAPGSGADGPGAPADQESLWAGPLGKALLLIDLLTVEKRWESFLPGIDRHWVYCATADGPAAALLRFQPGACVPLHEHRGYEHIFVLQGEQADENGIATAGSLLVHPPGTRHRVVSATGCMVLAIYEKPVRFIEPLPRLRAI